ncbi:hypothetical protein PHYSODRAFT_393751, partial [Phytophthora sojae]
MVKLFCLLVGVAGRSFEVTLDGSEGGDRVLELTEAIAKANPDEALKVFLAVKNGEWLGVNSEDVKKLRKGETTAFIEELTEELDLDTASSLYGLLQTVPQLISADQIHVLVKLPQ